MGLCNMQKLTQNDFKSGVRFQLLMLCVVVSVCVGVLSYSLTHRSCHAFAMLAPVEIQEIWILELPLLTNHILPVKVNV